jgi:putative ABC transport system permease protein
VRARALFTAALRESRGARGRLLLFTACLALGAMAVTGVAGMARAVRAAIALQSQELLGADLWVRSRAPLRAGAADRLLERMPEGARVAEVRLLQTMARSSAGGASRLVELKAVGPSFPFHGTLALEPAGTLAAFLGPESVVVARELSAALGLATGDELELGAARFRVAAFVLDEPGRLDPTFTAGPRVFASLEGFERMQLGGIGSRMTHGVLVGLPDDAGPASDWMRAASAAVSMESGVVVQTHETAQPQVGRAARRVERFLGLVALLSLVLGGVGVAEIVRAWIGTRLASIGVLRVLGFTPREVFLVYAGNVLLLALLGSGVGALVGSLLPLGAPRLLPELLPSGVGLAWEPLVILRGLGLGALVALAFSLPALLAVRRVPPVRVLRHEAEPLGRHPAASVVAAAVLAGAVFVAAWVQADGADLAAWFTGGAAALLGLLLLGARILTLLAGWTPRRALPPALVHALAALARPGAGVLGAVSALGLGTLVVVTLLLVETRLSDRLAHAIPTGGASVFFLDLQTDQRQTFERVLAQEGASSVRVVPLTSARLTAIRRPGENDGPGQHRWILGREQRLTWMEALTPDNRIVAGELWSDPERFEVSLEEGYAEDLRAPLGTVLVFELMGVPFELTVTSLRAVEWESFGINFFVVAEPGALEDAPHALLAAAEVPAEREQSLQDALLAALPNLTVIRVRSILDKVRRVLARSALAVQALGTFTAAVGLVLLSGVASLGALRRTREAALWKVLGVTRAGVARLFALEFALQGALAGLLGAGGACALAWGFFEHVLELGSDVPAWTMPAAALAAGALAALAGLAACARALRAPPIESLRG